MIRYIHRDPRFEKQLELLRKGGKKAIIAVREAEAIIQGLIGGRRLPDSMNAITKSGEWRIKNCIKYDLGTGYRLITIRDHDMLHISFIGTHDECNRWLETQKRLQTVFLKSRSAPIPVEQDEYDFTGISDAIQPEQEDDASFQSIEDKYLRMVFSGLIGRNSD